MEKISPNKNVAVYAGSFDPFHKGHYNILCKARDVFDQVIVSIGKNPLKSEKSHYFPKKELISEGFFVDEFEGLLTKYLLSSKKFQGNQPTLVRGLRNSQDLNLELNQYRFMQDQYPEIKLVSIFCDKEYEHISSSSIRSLYLLGEENEAISYLHKFEKNS